MFVFNQLSNQTRTVIYAELFSWICQGVAFAKDLFHCSGSQLDRVSCTKLIFVILVLTLAEIGLAQESVHGKRECWSWRCFGGLWHFCKAEGPDDDEEETKHRCLRFLFHLGCLWIIFQRQKGGESSYWASLLILTWLRGGTHTLAASATLFHQQLPQHFTLLFETLSYPQHILVTILLCNTIPSSIYSTFHSSKHYFTLNTFLSQLSSVTLFRLQLHLHFTIGLVWQRARKTCNKFDRSM